MGCPASAFALALTPSPPIGSLSRYPSIPSRSTGSRSFHRFRMAANLCSLQSPSISLPSAIPSTAQRLARNSARALGSTQCPENGFARFQQRRSPSALPLVKAAKDSSEWEVEEECSADVEQADAAVSKQWVGEYNHQSLGLVPTGKTSLLSLSRDMAMGLVFQAASGTGWTTGSGLEGPSTSTEQESDEGSELKFPSLSKSPRRRMRVAFTCNKCGERTTRAINPHAYSDGTVFVQCKGCNVFHKLVDNLKLFHEMNGKIYRGYDIPWYANDQPYDLFGGQYPL